MRKFKRLTMTLALLITAVGGAWAQGPWTSGSCTVTLSNGTLTVSGNGAMADYEGDQPWNDYKEGITSLVVESGVTTVGKMAFNGWDNLTSVTLPEGLTSIGHRAFCFCSGLTSVTIPSTVTSIDADAFYDCRSMTDVNLYADPANLTWNEADCDDFNRLVMGSTKCHVLAEHLSAYETKFGSVVNATFVGDLQPIEEDIIVTPVTGKTNEWTFTMPASDVELQVEYYAESNLFLSKDALADKGSIAVKAGDLGVQFGDDGKSANTVTEGTPMTVTYTGTKKVLDVKVEKKATEPVLLTTITAADNSSFKSGSQTFGDVATVTLTGNWLTNDGSHGGWYCTGSNLTATISVTEANGANITSVKFYTAGGGSAEDKEAPFEVTTTSMSSSDITTYLNGNAIGSYGVSKIEVYGTK